MLLLNYTLGYNFSPFVNFFSAPYCVPKETTNECFKIIRMRITEKHFRMKVQKIKKET